MKYPITYALLILVTLTACTYQTASPTAEPGTLTVRTTPPPTPRVTTHEHAVNAVWEAFGQGALFHPEEFFLSSLLEGAWELGQVTGKALGQGTGETTSPPPTHPQQFRQFKRRFPTEAATRRLLLQSVPVLTTP